MYPSELIASDPREPGICQIEISWNTISCYQWWMQIFGLQCVRALFLAHQCQTHFNRKGSGNFAASV